MNKKKNLLKNSAILMIGKICTQFITFLLLPLYTLKLSTGDYGLIDLLMTYISLFVPIITLQIELAIFRYLIDCRQNKESSAKVISSSYCIVILVSIITIIIGIVLLSVFKFQYGYYILGMVIATIVANILLQTARGLGDNVGYSMGCVISGVTNILSNIFLLLFLNMGITSIFISTIIANLFCSLFICLKNNLFSYISIKNIDIKLSKEMLKYSFPMITNGLVWWVINASDRTLVSVILGTSSNGIYSISNKFSNIINSFYSVFNMSWTETVSLYIDDKDNFLKDTFNMIFKIICSFCLILVNSMFIVFPILIGPNFSSAYVYIPILIISSVFNMLAANLSSIYVAKKKTKEIAKTTIFASIANIVINLVLIKSCGLYAAAISTLIAFFMLFIMRYIDVKKYVDIRLSTKNILAMILFFISGILIYEINNIYLNAVNLIVSIVLLGIFNKKEIITILTKLKKRGEK